MHTIRSITRVFIILAVAFALVGFSPVRSPAATINVTIFTDEYNDTNTGCSLREAITSANSGLAFGGCTAGTAGFDIINLGIGTYILNRPGTNEDANATGDLDVNTSNIRIRGSYSGTTTINGGGLDRVFDIRAGTNLEDLIITNGQTVATDALGGKGGGIYTASNLTLTRVKVDSNKTGAGPDNGGGGVYNNGGDVSLSWSTVYGNHVGDGNTTGCGGGIYNLDTPGAGGTLALGGTDISNNTCGAVDTLYDSTGGDGGGLFSTGTDADITLDDVTISGNHAGDGIAVGAGSGGGIFITGAGSTLTIQNTTIDNNHAGDNLSGNPGGSGGGITNYSGSSIIIVNSTISFNFAGIGDDNESRGGDGGGIDNRGILYVFFGTIAGNRTGSGGCDISCMGGGIYNGPGGSTELHQSILADNLATGAGPDCSGSLAVNLSLVEDPAGCTITGAGNLFNEDPRLIDLEYNPGSYSTRTQALSPGSPAIDTIAGDECSFFGGDQTGKIRPLDGDHDGLALCDMGAFEATFLYGFLPLVRH
jgi:CSLREA domain-containing protein